MPEPSQLSPRSDFRLDVDLANQAVAKLEEVRERLTQIRFDAGEVARIPATAHDPVSQEASALLARLADGGPGSLAAALEAGIGHVDGLISQLRVDIAQFEEQERVAASELDTRG